MQPFLPFGVNGRDVVDPATLTRDFLEAARIAQRMSQWQFAEDGFTDTNLLTLGDHVRVHNNDRRVELQTVSGIDPILTSAMGAPDTDLFQIPYNRGMVEIDPAGDGDVAAVYVSDYPELTLIVYPFQYIRIDQEDFDDYDAADPDTWLHIRASLSLSIDGARMPGGPFTNPVDTKYRGAGLGQRSCRSCLFAIQMLPAGPHRIAALAGVAPAVKTESEGYTDEASVLTNPPVEGICIGSRRMIVVRFGRGRWLRA